MSDTKDKLDQVTKIGQEIEQSKPSADELLREARDALVAYGIGERTKPIISRIDAHLASQPASHKVSDAPLEAIGKVVTDLMNHYVSNGANSVSMPDECVEVAAWLCGVKTKPASQPDCVAVPVSLVDRITTMLETYGEFGMQCKYEDGTDTPNAKLCFDTVAMLRAAKEAK